MAPNSISLDQCLFAHDWTGLDKYQFSDSLVHSGMCCVQVEFLLMEDGRLVFCSRVRLVFHFKVGSKVASTERHKEQTILRYNKCIQFKNISIQKITGFSNKNNSNSFYYTDIISSSTSEQK